MRNWTIVLLKGWGDPGPNVPHSNALDGGKWSLGGAPAQFPLAEPTGDLPQALSSGHTPRFLGIMPGADREEGQSQGRRMTPKIMIIKRVSKSF